MPFPAAPTLGSGAVAYGPTTADIPARLKPRFFDKEIIDWESDLYPSASIVMKESKKTKAAPEWSRWERKPFPHWMTVELAAASTVTDMTTHLASDLTRITRADVWQCDRTREVMLMNGVAATPYDTIVRGVGDVPAQALVPGDKLVKVGTSHPELSLAPTAHFVLEEEIPFYAAEHMVSVESSSHVLATSFDPQGSKASNRHMAQVEARRVEFTEIMKRSFISSAMARQTAAAGQQQTVRGVIQHAATWSYNFNGILTRPDFFGYIADGPGRYIKGDIGIAMSSFGLGIVNNWLLDDPTKRNSDVGTLGYNVDTLKLVAGRRAKLFYEAWFDESPLTQGWIVVFPLNKKQGSSYVEVVGPEWNGRVRLEQDIKKEDGYRGRKDVWYSFYGWEHGPEICYGFGYGIEG